MLVWINKVWKPYVAGRPALLILDRFGAHFTNEVKAAFACCKTTVLLIPGGCTSVLQPLDVCVNKPFKNYIRQSWMQYMLNESDKDQIKIPPPAKLLLLEWIK